MGWWGDLGALPTANNTCGVHYGKFEPPLAIPPNSGCRMHCRTATDPVPPGNHMNANLANLSIGRRLGGASFADPAAGAGAAGNATINLSAVCNLCVHHPPTWRGLPRATHALADAALSPRSAACGGVHQAPTGSLQSGQGACLCAARLPHSGIGVATPVPRDPPPCPSLPLPTVPRTDPAPTLHHPGAEDAGSGSRLRWQLPQGVPQDRNLPPCCPPPSPPLPTRSVLPSLPGTCSIAPACAASLARLEQRLPVLPLGLASPATRPPPSCFTTGPCPHLPIPVLPESPNSAWSTQPACLPWPRTPPSATPCLPVALTLLHQAAATPHHPSLPVGDHHSAWLRIKLEADVPDPPFLRTDIRTDPGILPAPTAWSQPIFIDESGD
eukprot:gene2813-3423_t